MYKLTLNKLMLNYFQQCIRHITRSPCYTMQIIFQPTIYISVLWRYRGPLTRWLKIVYYVPRRIMRVITRRATMLAEDRSQGVVKTKPRRDQCCEHFDPLTPKITDFLTHFWPLLTKRKTEYIMTKPCIMFLGLLFRFLKPELHYRALENQYGRFYFKKYRKFEIFFLFFFFLMDKAYWSISNHGQRWAK